MAGTCMIILIDTSTPICRIALVDDAQQLHEHEWESGRNLADGLLQFLHDTLGEHCQTFEDITGICVMKGAGSFTGLRIGITVMNTIARDRHVPIVGVRQCADWRAVGLDRLRRGENDSLVMPHYGSDPHITEPRK